MGDLGIVVSIANTYAMVHDTDCPYYRRAVNTKIPLPALHKVRTCSVCAPRSEDVAALIEKIPKYDGSPQHYRERT